MAQPYATGAVFVFVAPPKTTTPQYFGTCEKMPQDTRNPDYELLMNDMSGTKKPLDLAFEGEDAQVGLVMTRWTESLAQQMENKPTGAVSAATGSWNLSDVGSLMGLENLTWNIWLCYLFGSAMSAKAPYVGLKPGRHYVQSIIWAPETEEIGTAPMKRHFLFYAWPMLVTSSGAKANGTTQVGGFKLFDYDMTGCTLALIT